MAECVDVGKAAEQGGAREMHMIKAVSEGGVWRGGEDHG